MTWPYARVSPWVFISHDCGNIDAQTEYHALPDSETYDATRGMRQRSIGIGEIVLPRVIFKVLIASIRDYI